MIKVIPEAEEQGAALLSSPPSQSFPGNADLFRDIRWNFRNLQRILERNKFLFLFWRVTRNAHNKSPNLVTLNLKYNLFTPPTKKVPVHWNAQ